MKRVSAALLSVLILGLCSGTSFGQMMGGPPGGPMRGEQGMRPISQTETSFAVISPDSKYVYIIVKDVMYQYFGEDLKLKKSINIGSYFDWRTNSGWSVLFSGDSRRMYVMKGRTMILLDAVELDYIARTSIDTPQKTEP